MKARASYHSQVVALRSMTLALFFSMTLWSSPVLSMSLSKAPLETLIMESDLAVRGVVLSHHVERIPGHSTALRTHYTLWVWEHLKAPRIPEHAQTPDPDVVTFVQPGGSAEGLTTRVPGVVSLQAGDEVVLLLTDTPWGLQPIGYPMGTFRVDLWGRVKPTWTGHPAPLVDRLLGSGSGEPLPRNLQGRHRDDD